LPRIEDITHPSIEGSGVSAGPIGMLGGKSAVRNAPLRLGIENTHAQTLTTISLLDRVTLDLQPGFTSPDHVPVADGVN
jgi:hypothetical protein